MCFANSRADPSEHFQPLRLLPLPSEPHGNGGSVVLRAVRLHTGRPGQCFALGEPMSIPWVSFQGRCILLCWSLRGGGAAKEWVLGGCHQEPPVPTYLNSCHPPLKAKKKKKVVGRREAVHRSAFGQTPAARPFWRGLLV